MTPSIFTTKSADIVATSCPKFDESMATLACQARLDAAARVTVELRAKVATEWANNLQDPKWAAQMNAPPLFPAPPAFGEPAEVARLRGVLPPELFAPINGSGLSPDGQLQMAQYLEQRLDSYRAALLRAGDPHAVHKDRLEFAFSAAKVSGYPPSRKPDVLHTPSLGMIPTGNINTIATKRRYFRVLVWNLENFTRDRRPRGSAPIDALRNQARVAIVSELMVAFDADLLLVMETGQDVGTAMTAIAKRIEDKGEKGEVDKTKMPYGVHALVSPPTGALPSVKNVYSKVNLKRRTWIKALALRTLFEVYDVTSQDKSLPVTAAQVTAAWGILREASPGAKLALPEWGAEQLVIQGKSGRFFPHPEAIAGLRGMISTPFSQAKLNSDLPDMIYTLAGDVAALTAQFAEETSLDLKTPLLREIYDDFCNGAQILREMADEANDLVQDATNRAKIVGYSQGIELLLLFLLQSLAGGIPDDDSGWVFASSQANDERLTLAVYLTAVSSSLRFDAIDKAVGPLGGDVDQDVVLTALERLGIVKWQIETYGMVYRPPSEDALARLFDIGVKAHGYKGGAEDQAAKYDIVRGNLSGGGFSVQQSGGLLNWRSALQITVPVNDTLSVPFALFHTRYSGSAQITEKYKSERNLTGEEATVMARADTMVTMAKALLPGHSRFGMPLIVGDFNIPADYLDPSDATNAPVVRKQGVRKFLLEGMGASGYLRHTAGGQLGVGHPRTTLKSFGGLGLGDLDGSQPYDGVYEPFDFALRNAVLQSGVVKPTAIITLKALNETIQGVAVAVKDAVDLDAAETQDTATDETSQEDANDAAASGNSVSATAGQAAAREVARIYAACARRLVGRIVKMIPWFEHLEKMATRTRTKASIYSTGTPSAELLQNIKNLREIGKKFLPDEIEKRQTWFAERCEKNEYIKYPDAGPFIQCKKVFVDVMDQAKRCKIVSETLDGLADELDQVDKQLANFELNGEVRSAVAYRAIVSDHLPQIVELDLDPGP